MARDREPQSQTQGATQSQSSNIWSQVESQPIENIVWGRLYGKNIKVKSLGTTGKYKILYLNSSFSVGNIMFSVKKIGIFLLYVICVLDVDLIY